MNPVRSTVRSAGPIAQSREPVLPMLLAPTLRGPRRVSEQIADRSGPDPLLQVFLDGGGTKTDIVLDHAPAPLRGAISPVTSGGHVSCYNTMSGGVRTPPQPASRPQPSEGWPAAGRPAPEIQPTARTPWAPTVPRLVRDGGDSSVTGPVARLRPAAISAHSLEQRRCRHVPSSSILEERWSNRFPTRTPRYGPAYFRSGSRLRRRAAPKLNVVLRPVSSRYATKFWVSTRRTSTEATSRS